MKNTEIHKQKATLHLILEFVTIKHTWRLVRYLYVLSRLGLWIYDKNNL